jgi:hypothetical protein
LLAIAAAYSREQPEISLVPQPQRNDARTLVSALGALLVAADSTGRLKDSRAVLDGELDRLQDNRSQLEKLMAEFSDWSISQKDDTEARLVSFAAAAEETLAIAKLALDQHIEKSAAAVDRLTEKLKADIVIQAPTTYWRAKAKSHYKVAAAAGTLFLVVIASGLYWLAFYSVDFVAEASSRLMSEETSPSIGLLIPVVFITIPALAVGWLLRHVSRLIIQSLSLAADAGLRGTIATTYRALSNDRTASEAEVALVLQALFRPIDGSGHAEIAPPSLAEVLNMGKQ